MVVQMTAKVVRMMMVMKWAQLREVARVLASAKPFVGLY